MKECPVCNEVFTDEFKFCDLDGARLRRKSGSDNGRWSNVGVLLLLAAIILSVGFIFFFPKGNGAPPLTPGAEAPMRPAQSKADVAQQEKTEALAPPAGAEPPIESQPLEPIAPPQPPPKPPQPEKSDKKGGLYKAFKQIYGDN